MAERRVHLAVLQLEATADSAAVAVVVVVVVGSRSWAPVAMEDSAVAAGKAATCQMLPTEAVEAVEMVALAAAAVVLAVLAAASPSATGPP